MGARPDNSGYNYPTSRQKENNSRATFTAAVG